MKRIYTLLFAFTICCLSINSFSQISFTSDVTTGCKPLTVTFTNTSTDPNVVYYLWDWNDGTPGWQGFDTAHTFENNGYYNAFLRAYDSSWNFLGDYYVQIYVIGVSSIIAPDSACPDEAVNFQNYDNANSWFWDFGDGNTASTQYTSHTYTSTGNFTVSLISNSSCGDDTLYKNINISNNLYPNPNFSFYYNNVCPNTPISFYPFYTTASYYWDFGDGFTDTISNVNHSYSSPGTYYVTYTASNGCGNSTSKTDSVFIVSTAYFDENAFIDIAPDSACPNEQINFYAPYNGVSYVWNFGDGSPLDTTADYYNYHSYSSFGYHNASVKMFNGCGNDTTYNVIVPIVNTVGFPAGMDISHNAPVCPNENVSFYSPSGYINYIWNYGDGSPDDSSGNYYATHSYSSLSTYAVSVKFTNNCGVDTTLYVTIDITNEQPIPNSVTINNYSPACPGETVQLYTDYGFEWYVWNYGDGSPVDSVNLNDGGYYRYHTYTSVNNYTASVTIYNSCGNDTTLYTTVEITNSEPISNSVIINNNSPACPGESVQMGTDSGFEWYVWNYGDGSLVDSVAGNDGGYYRYHTYNSIGLFTASVTIYNSCGSDSTLYTTVDINTNAPFPPNVYFSSSAYQGACPNENVNFNAENGYASYEWDFGDGNSTTTNDAYTNHSYASVGTYNTSVTIYNSCGNDTTLYTQVDILNYVPFPSSVEVYANNNTLCPGQYTDIYTNYSGGVSYLWNFGDGTPNQTTSNYYVYHTFTSLGVKTVSVTITNNCGNDTTVSTTVNVEYPSFPSMDIYINGSPACPNEDIGFSTQGGYYKYQWNFGDGTPAQVTYGNPNFNHAYNDTGIYTVSVKIFQNCGIDVYQYPNLYNDTIIYATVVIGNNVGFSSSVSLSSGQGTCSSDFNFYASSGYASYEWNFGDGTDSVSSGGYVNHSYATTGTFNVSVQITNYCGLDTTLYTTVNVSQLGYGQFIPYCFSCDPGDPSYDPNNQQYFFPVPTTNQHGSDIYIWGSNYVQSICPGENVYLNTIAGVYYGMMGGYDNQIYSLMNNVNSAVWNYGDGSPSDSVAVFNWLNEIYTSHVFNSVGTDTFSVTLYHKCGNDTTLYGVIEVDTAIGFPNGASMNAYDNPCVNQTVYFSATSGHVSYEWDFGDGSALLTTSNSSTTYQYSTPGMYNASVKITNFCGNDTIIYKTIDVVDYKPFPEMSFMDISPQYVCPGENVNFYVDAGWDIVSYEWNFGDGSPIVTTNNSGSGGGMGGYISHSYSDTAVYTASVTATNSCGNDTTLSVTVNVVGYKSFPGGMNMNVNPLNACPGDNIYFNTDYGYASYQWDFGNGTSGTNSPYVNHSYNSTGTYSAMVTITNFCGNDTTLVKSVTITDDLAFGPYTPYGENWYVYSWPYTACPGQNVNFNAPYGLPYYIWDFGDGTIDSTTNFYYANHTYQAEGSYAVAVTFINNCGSDTTLYTSVTIDNNLGFPNLYMNINPNTVCPGQNVNIEGPWGYAYYVFDYGDGSPKDSLTESFSNHSYNNAGTYNVTITIYNHCGLSTSISSPVNINNNVVFTYAPWVFGNPNPVCPGQEVNLYAENGHASYLWNFDDGSQALGSSQVQHIFDTLKTYNVKVKISNYCGNDTTVFVNIVVSDTITFIPDTGIAISPSVSCPGDMVQLSVGSGYQSYRWIFGDGDTLLTTGSNVEHIYSAPGNYNASVKITNGCGFSKTIYKAISVNSNAPVDTSLAVEIPFNPNCPGDEVFFNVINGASTYIFNWNFADGSADSTVGTGTSHIYSDTGSYPVTVTATNGCGNTQTIIVNAEIEDGVVPFLEAGVTFGFGTGESEGIAGCPGDAVLFWFAGTYDNVWDFGNGNIGTATEQVMSGIGVPLTVIKQIFSDTGTYNVKLTVTNNCGNSITDSISVKISNNLLVNGSIFIAPPTGSSGYTTCMSIDMIGTGGASYSWDFGDGDTITTISPTISHTYSQPGTYTVKLKATNGCGYSATYFSTLTVNGIGGPDVSAVTTDASCSGSSDGFATVTVNDGISPFTYQWDVAAGSQAGATATGLAAGTYSVSVTDNIGCSSVKFANVSEPSDISITSSSVSSTCGSSDGSATVTVSGGSGTSYSYAWSSGGTTDTETGLSAGNYSVTVTNNLGCSKIGNVSVNNGNAATVSLSGSANVSCNGGNNGSVNITVTGGTSPYTYLWSNGETTEDLTNLSAGTYSVTITDDNGCFSGQTVVITQPNTLSVSTSVTNANCGTANGSATVNPLGGTNPYSYLWDENTGSKTTQTITGFPAGSYTVTVTDANGCTSSITAIISNANAPTIISVATNVSCNGLNNGSIDLTVTGGSIPYTYNWSTGNNVQDENNLAPSNYLVIITDGSGCQSIRNFTITEPNALTASASTVAATCGNADGSANVTHTGGNTSFTYSWDNSQTSATATGLAAGSYSVTVTDNKGCTATAGTTVTSPSTFASSVTSDSVSCNSGNDGSASVAPAGGNSPYSYEWASAEITDTITGLSAGTYNVTITDMNSCISENSITVSEPGALSASFAITNSSCFGGNDASATVSASDGTAPYSYLWDNSETASQISNLTAQMYYVTVTDANNCTHVDSVNVGQETAIVPDIVANGVACFGNANGSVFVTVSGGAGNFTYLWEDASTNPNRFNLAPGTYYITITDANNCTKEDSATVGEPAQLTATISSTDASCKDVCDGTAIVIPDGGTSPYTYLWSNSDSSATADSLCDGIVSVDITDANNCQTTKVATIAEPDVLAVSVSAAGTTCANNDGSATTTTSGGTTPYSYLWSDTGTDSTATGLGTGAIDVTVTDANGCTASGGEVIVIVVPPVEVCIVTVDDSNTQNQIIWEKPAVNYIDSFRVYRDFAGIFTHIGSVQYADLSKFVDTTNGVNPAVQSYKYRISAVDNCGNESALSGFHKTMHLNPPILQSGQVILLWDNYEGFGTSNFYYRILRDSTGTGNNFDVVDSTASGNITWTDIAPPTGNLNYLIEVVHPFGGCLAELKAENHNSSRSNKGQMTNQSLSANTTVTDASGAVCDGEATVEASGGASPYTYLWDNGQTTATATGLCGGTTYNVTVTDNSGAATTASATIGVQPGMFEVTLENMVQVYPNPNGGRFELSVPDSYRDGSKLSVGMVKIYNMLGEVVYQSAIDNNQPAISIDIGKTGSGMYYIQINTDKGTLNKKIVVN